MGKITSIYLTDEEATELKKFCDENLCTKYSALKTALRELLSRPMKEETVVPQEKALCPTEHEIMEETEEALKRDEAKKAMLRRLLASLS